MEWYCCWNIKQIRLFKIKYWRKLSVSAAILIFLCSCCILMNCGGKMATNTLPSLPSETETETETETRALLMLRDDENLLRSNIGVQNIQKRRAREMNKEGREILNEARRLLGGPGSSPPRCKSKCGGCTPCKAVHVPVPPGTPVITEYYPEAWRCKCGNRLYMP